MGTLITVLIVTTSVIVLLLLIALVIGKDMDIVKTITIHKSKPEVFEFVKFIKNHDHFSVWAMMDPEMKKEYRGTDGTVGFVYAWDSIKKKNVGAGEQEIKKIVPGESIEFELRFTRPMQDVAKAVMIFTPVDATQTTVQWGFHSKMKFPMNLMKPMIQNMLGKDLETGLSNLKSYLEKK